MQGNRFRVSALILVALPFGPAALRDSLSRPDPRVAQIAAAVISAEEDDVAVRVGGHGMCKASGRSQVEVKGCPGPGDGAGGEHRWGGENLGCSPECAASRGCGAGALEKHPAISLGDAWRPVLAFNTGSGGATSSNPSFGAVVLLPRLGQARSGRATEFWMPNPDA